MPDRSEDQILTRDYTLADLRFRFTQVDGKLRIQNISVPGTQPLTDVTGGQLWERVPILLHIRGRMHWAHYGARSIHSETAIALKLQHIEQTSDAIIATMIEPDTQLVITLRYQSYGAPGGVRVTAEARNAGPHPITLEQFLICLPGMGRPENPQWGATTTIHVANNTWLGEAQWNQFKPSHLGISDTVSIPNDMPNTSPCFSDSLGAAVWRNDGTWSTINHLPMGVLEDRDSGLSWFWQLEHSGSWQMEIARTGGAFYLAAGLPSMRRGDWYITLEPGETYAAAPISFGCAQGGFEQAIAVLQEYRRKACLLRGPDDERPLIFNDCMQCLCANPTLENSLPVIEAAAAAGAEYYVMDAGWFDPRSGPQMLGDWIESADRFGATGLKGLFDIVRAKGMKPGLWIEIEMASRPSEIFKKPDSWFLCSHGHRVMSFDRYFLNFANPEVRQYAHAVIDRLCRDYGIKYLKLDYNADGGLGDNQTTPSLGAGQVAAYRGFYQWLDELRQHHPDLLIENCGSGGQRFEYGLLSRTHVHSTSDTNDHRRYPSIMAGCLAAGLPEQMCVWSCPHGGQDDETVCMNLVTPMLSRWHLAGRVDHLTDAQRAMTHEAIALWKSRIREFTPHMVPFWPTPLRHLHEQNTWLAAGLRNDDCTHAFMCIYRLDSDQETYTFPLTSLRLGKLSARVIFPTTLPTQMSVTDQSLTVTLKNRYSARFIEIRADQ